MASTNISYHMHKDTDKVQASVKVNEERALAWVEFNLLEDGNLISSFTIFDEDGRNLAKTLIEAGNELANIYRAREQEEYDNLRQEEEWEWVAREAARAKVEESKALGIPRDVERVFRRAGI